MPTLRSVAPFVGAALLCARALLAAPAAPSATSEVDDPGFDVSGSHPLPNGGTRRPDPARGCGCTLDAAREHAPRGATDAMPSGAALLGLLARRRCRTRLLPGQLSGTFRDPSGAVGLLPDGTAATVSRIGSTGVSL